VSWVITGTLVVFGGLERVDEDKWGGENDSTRIVSISGVIDY
jgi:hypothetical protein